MLRIVHFSPADRTAIDSFARRDDTIFHIHLSAGVHAAAASVERFRRQSHKILGQSVAFVRHVVAAVRRHRIDARSSGQARRFRLVLCAEPVILGGIRLFHIRHVVTGRDGWANVHDDGVQRVVVRLRTIVRSIHFQTLFAKTR